MEELLEQLKAFGQKNLSYEGLGEFVRRINVEELDHLPKLPAPEEGNYSRNILMMEPLECVLLYWPPGVESAIHWHEGFWGYVLVLEGECSNLEYRYKENELVETNLVSATTGGVLNEPDGVVHKLSNSSDEPTVTLHFYHPALQDLNNMVIFDEEGRKAVLNEQAGTASFNQDATNFHSKEENAFKYSAFEDRPGIRTHRIAPIIPKPSNERISEMVGEYYDEQASDYDMFDLEDASRKKFVERVDALIADDWKYAIQPEEVLMVACGTGRRGEHIKEISEIAPTITGVDMSNEMCEVARSRGVNAINADWSDVELPDAHFDCATFLYAFGHIPNKRARQVALDKLHDKLKPGGALFFDVFNAMDLNEWGPNALENYFRNHLYEFGYERGDVFYKKVGGTSTAFLHYFYQDELHDMLENAGFQVEYIKHIGYVHRSGELLGSANEGSLFIKAIRKK